MKKATIYIVLIFQKGIKVYNKSCLTRILVYFSVVMYEIFMILQTRYIQGQYKKFLNE